MDLIVKVEGRNIQTNFAEYNAWLDQALKPYRGLVVQDDQIKECKRIRAELNKAEKAINSRKIEIKKQFMMPYTEFENQTKKLMSKISEVSADIDSQIKDYEDRQKESRRAWMREWWNTNGIMVKYDIIHNEDMLKMSITDKAVMDWLVAMKENIESDLIVISDMPGEEKDFVMDDYQQTANLPQSIRNYREWKERNERIREAKESRESETMEQKVFARAEITGYWKDLDKVKNYAESIGVDVRYITMQYTGHDDGLPF